MDKQTAYRYTLMRGGTSKAFFFKWNELPSDPGERDRVILAIFGSPDARQIDGLGGSWEGYSKVAIIAPPSIEGADVDYSFGQVQIREAFIDWFFNCGNISAAVGPYAIQEGMVKVTEPYTTVRIHVTNTHQILIARVPVCDGQPRIYGDYVAAGVPGTGARIDINNRGLVGSATGRLLPTGNVRDTLLVDGLGEVTCSFVDISNPFVFVSAETVGAIGTENRLEIEANRELLARCVAIRCAAAERLGFVEHAKDATAKSPSRPSLAFVARSASYRDYSSGKMVREEDMDFMARNIFNNTAHDTFQGTGAICLAVASMIPGTVVYDVNSEKAKESGLVRFGHPRGIMEVRVAIDGDSSTGYAVREASVGRTARRLAEGVCFVRNDVG
jgi:hypothetical protein